MSFNFDTVLNPPRPKRSLLAALCNTPGASGHEQPVKDLFLEQVGQLGMVVHDGLGGAMVEREGSKGGPRILLDAHLDEVGFMVKAIQSNGLIRFVCLGGWAPEVLPAQMVEIHTPNGTVLGVITARSAHFKQNPAFAELRIDVGATSESEVKGLGITIGNVAVPATKFSNMAHQDRVCAKALDNRAGVGVMIEVMRHLENATLPNTLIAGGSVQEEVGIRGAAAMAHLAKPDVVVVLEAPPADDVLEQDCCQGRLGCGPQLRLYDPTCIMNQELCAHIKKVADHLNIPVQLAVRESGGTNARGYQQYGKGVPVVVIGVPARYIHCHAGIMSWSDYLHMCHLVSGLVYSLDRHCVDGFTRRKHLRTSLKEERGL
ncbi:MAG: M20/M25/M40 family metallo-hydrolase [Pseudomonadota bacterium]|nr:M20/M25/M40 family metallo-hydrolase [Pseudomonadota bacterium]MEC8461165.1 M20/M25/M40 family metallo-hydrolase [Pseudomonadota bacterium]